jgi:hypothetical protein
MLCKILKLTSGDTVIGNVVEESRGYIEVHRPMRVVIVPKVLEENTFHMSMMKWDPLINFTLNSRIFKQSIVSVSEATDDVLEVYTELYNQFEAGEHEENIVMQNRNQESEEFDTEEKVEKEIERMKGLAIVSANTQTIH